MKNIVRAFVLTLALTGMFASTRANATSATPASVSAAKTRAMPVPRCPPNDPNGCGIEDW